MIVVTTLWSFFTRVRALSPHIVLFPGWQGGTTNTSIGLVVNSTNESRGSVDRSGGGVGSAMPFPIRQAASLIDLA
jgi:hypothetical protein